MRIKALTLRILTQVLHDKRTLALVLILPMVILSLIYFIFSSDGNTLSIGIIDAPESFITALEENTEQEVDIIRINENEAEDAIKQEDIVAAVSVQDSGNEVNLLIDGSNATDAKKAGTIIKAAAFSVMQDTMKEQAAVTQDKLNALLATLQAVNPTLDLPAMDSTAFTFQEPVIVTEYLYGGEDASFFDTFGAPFIGIIIFFLVFLIAGINFLGERTSGTLEKLLSTPIRRYEIVLGYVLGFCILALLQTVIITLFSIYVLGLSVAGSIWYVFLIALLTAISALTLGILLSTLANSEFQMMQFIPVVIIPQIFLCGLFSLSKGWQIVGYFMPLHYTTNALTEVMVKGSGFSAIASDCGILLGCSILFMLLNTLLLKRYRAI